MAFNMRQLPVFIPALLIWAGCVTSKPKYSSADLQRCIIEIDRAVQDDKLIRTLEEKKLLDKESFEMFCKVEDLEAALIKIIYSEVSLFREFLARFRALVKEVKKEYLWKTLHEATTRNGVTPGFEVNFDTDRPGCISVQGTPEGKQRTKSVWGYMKSIRLDNRNPEFLDDLSIILVSETDEKIKYVITCAIGAHVRYESYLRGEYDDLADYPLSERTVRKLVEFLKDSKDHGSFSFLNVMHDLARGYYEYPMVRDVVLDFLENKDEDPEEREDMFDLCKDKGDHGFTLIAYKILLDETEDKSLRRRAAWHHLRGYSQRKNFAGRAEAMRIARSMERDPFVRDIVTKSGNWE